MGADALLSAAQWEVSKALAPVADGVLEAWADSMNLGLNIEAIRTELLLVHATLENAARKELGGSAMEMMLERLRVSAHSAQDLLDELDYFRIHDMLHNNYEAADLHAFDARHTAKGISKLFNCCRWHRQRPRGNSSSAPSVNQEETPLLEFNRVDFSQRMKNIVEKLQLMRKDINGVLQSRDTRSLPNIAQNRPTSIGQVDEPKLYGRDRVVDIIRDITYGQYDKGLTVLPVVGPGGIGKTTLIQHIYCKPEVQHHFDVMIWICVSVNFNLDKVLEHIRTCTPEVGYERRGSTTEELIEERLRSKRFLLVLDDMWQVSNWDDWGRLLSTLSRPQVDGSMILVTTRFQAIAQKVKTTGHSIKLNGLKTEDFRQLFFAFVFGDEGCPRDKDFLLGTGDKIMEKLKGSPLAAKTASRLLYKDLNLQNWNRVLRSKGWEKENADNDIMPTLKLSYDFLPFHLQQCFACSALFPEDYHFKSDELINLWIGLDILIPSGQNQTFEDIGLSNLNELVMHGFFKEEEIDDGPCYVMHLMHDLALKVASHDYLSLRLGSVGSVEIQSTTRHLSISTDDLGKYDAVSGKKLMSELEELRTRFKVEDLQTLMLFGEMDEGFFKIFGDFFGKANALRILRLPNMVCPVESMLYNFSRLIHLRYLSLGTEEKQMDIPLSISKFYHLRILDLELWDGRRDLPEDISNLAKLCHFYVPSDDQLHSDIYNVGKLKLLEELKVFQVNKKSEGFEPKQLEHLTMLRELGIYNLEKIDTIEVAAQARLMKKKYLRRLTLDWDSKRSSIQPGVEAAVLESLQPHGDVQVLCIRGHGGSSCPTWLGDGLAVEALQSLWFDGVSWEVFPCLGKAWDLRELRLKDMARLKEFIIGKSFCMLIKLELIGLASFEKWVHPAELEASLGEEVLPSSGHVVFTNWFPKLQELEVCDCPEFFSPISLTESLCSVKLVNVKLLERFAYSKSANELEIVGKGDLNCLDQVLVFNKEIDLQKLTLVACPPLELKHLLTLASLKTLIVQRSHGLVGPLRGQGDVEWQLPVEHIKIEGLNGNSGKELAELLPHLPKLSKLEIEYCKNIKQLVVGVGLGLQPTTAATSEMEEGEITAAQDEEDDGVLFFPSTLCDSLQELFIWECPELVLMNRPTLVPGGGWLQALRSLQRLIIWKCPRFFPVFSFSHHIFPNPLVTLLLDGCGEDLKCQGLQSLLTTGGQLNELHVFGSPRFFAGWGDVEGEEQQPQLVSSALRVLMTDDVAGFFAAPICSFLSFSLTELHLDGYESKGMEHFNKQQEHALQLLSSLQKLQFSCFKDLQQLPEGLHNLTSLKKLTIYDCPAASSFPNDGLPKLLQELNVECCHNQELKQQCRGLEGTIPKIKID